MKDQVIAFVRFKKEHKGRFAVVKAEASTEAYLGYACYTEGGVPCALSWDETRCGDAFTTCRNGYAFLKVPK